jgi:hypothetical protein
MHSARRSPYWWAAFACAGIAGSGCGVEGDLPEANVDTETSPIIGGSPVSLQTRRALGLVDVNTGCSGSLFNFNWVLTATHCLNFGAPTSNTFTIPRPDGSLETRGALYIEQVGPTDLSIVQLAGSAPGSPWPNVNRSMVTTAADSLVGQTMTCYGRGATAYANPAPGLTGFNIWQSYVPTIASIDQGVFRTFSPTGTPTGAPGDSGGGCFINNRTVAVASWGMHDCSNNSTPQTCEQTITKITSGGWRSTPDFANYINQAPARTATVNFRQLGYTSTAGPNLDFLLPNGWVNHPFGTNDAQIAQAPGGMLQLRGAIETTGTNPVAFTIPAGLTPSSDVYLPINLCSSTKGRLYITPGGVVTVQAEGGAWANAQCFTSLEGVAYAQNSTGFTQLTLENGWFHSPYNTRPAAAKATNSVVRFQGAIAGGSSNAPFTLPPDFRPQNVVYLPVDLCNAAKGRLILQPNGWATIQTFGPFGDAQCFTSLEGLTYQTDSFLYTPLTPANGWSNAGFGTRNAGVTNDGGIIRFQGAIKTSGTNPIVFKIPPEMRPATNVYVAVDLCGAAKGRLLIQPSGVVSVQAISGGFGAAQCMTSLEGASFGL